MKRGTVVGLILGVGAAAMVAVAGWYGYQRQNFVVTNYAWVNAPAVWVKTNSTVEIRQVNVHDGQSDHQGDVLLVEALPGQKTISVTAPVSGTVGPVAVDAGSTVPAGASLLPVISLHQADVIAEVSETDVEHVKPGQSVDVGLPGQPNTVLHGFVQRVGKTSLANTSPLLNIGTFSKQVQWIPVTIRLANTGTALVAGESATVRIHR